MQTTSQKDLIIFQLYQLKVTKEKTIKKMKILIKWAFEINLFLKQMNERQFKSKNINKTGL